MRRSKRRLRSRIGLFTTAIMISVSAAVVLAGQADPLETIFIVRSIRESRVDATDFCNERRTGIVKATIEDTYSFRSVATSTSDGRVTKTNVAQVATGHACLGPTREPNVLAFYMEGVLGGISYRGKGQCRSGADAPEPGVTPQTCLLNLSGMPGYVGGQLATNTVVTRAILGDKSEPQGYTQSSIAVIRLWKHRMGADRSKR